MKENEPKLEDLYLKYEPITMRVGLVNFEGIDFGPPKARIQAVSGEGALERDFVQVDEAWELKLDDLAPGSTERSS